jgi:hypothetical protein
MCVIFPAPKKISFRKTLRNFSDFAWITAPEGTDCILKEKLIAFAADTEFFFRRRLRVTAGTPQNGKIFLSVKTGVGGIPGQGYKMRAGADGVSLAANDAAGAFYGLLTMRRILESYGPEIPDFFIEDAPDIARRGFMLDVSRCKVPKMETLLNFVDLMASVKLNELQLYIEHTFAFSGHETIWRDSSPFTASEILTLDIHCRKNYIELVPNFNSFGHFERWLRHPEYKKYADSPDGFAIPPWGGKPRDHGSMLKPDKASLGLLSSLYDEYLPNFNSRFFNVGCDETVELGLGWSKKLCDKKGKTKVYLDFLLEIDKLVKKHGRRMMFWGDIILNEPQYVKDLPSSLIALAWGYEKNHNFKGATEKFAESGAPFYVCPGTSSWGALTGRTNNCLGNLLNAAETGIANGTAGFLNTDWGDCGHHQYQPFSYLGMLAGAAYSWSLKTNKNADIPTALDTLIFKDKTGKTGRLFYELGNVYESIAERSCNCTHFHRFLFGAFDDAGERDALLRNIRASEIKNCLSELTAFLSAVPALRPECADAALIKREIINIIEMARFGCLKARIFTERKKTDFSTLKNMLGDIVMEHETLWLERNRPGGLRESSDHLRKNFIILEKLCC